MKKVCLIVLAVMLLTVRGKAAELPDGLERALPNEAEKLLRGTDFSRADALTEGLAQIAYRITENMGKILRGRIRNAAAVLLAALVCGVIGGFHKSAGTLGGPDITLAAGALTVTVLTAGSLDSLMGLGARTIQEIVDFSQVLVPAMAVVTAAAGAVGTASVHQVATLFFAEGLLQLIRRLLLPAVYLYVGVLAAGAMLSNGRLNGIAAALKKSVTWVLSTALLLFTLYLSAARVISGTVDSAAIKVTKAAISGAVPVIGGILSDAAESVLAGAGVLKGAVGAFGVLAMVAICAGPFLQLGAQYLLYKLAAFLASAAAPEGLCRLIDGLGGTFGLVLGMTGACALLVLVSVLSSAAAVMA